MLRQAVVLVGGPDAPFGHQTATTPKSMLHVAGRPFLDTLIDEIVRYDAFEEILLLADHQAEPVLVRYTGAVRGRARLTLALERKPLGTAGTLAHAAGLLQKRFLLLNGASFFDFNLLDLVWRSGSGLVHMALRADTVGDRSDRVVLENDRVRAFVAPGHGAVGPANAGVYVIDRSIVDGIDRLPASLEQDVLPALAASGTLGGTCYRGYFVDVEHPELGRRFRYPGAPYLFNGTPWRVTRRPPLVGEHSGEILRDELAMAPEAIAVLAAEGVI